ncbi:MAG: hypothetical protein IJ993_03340 [Akkermansia sp.]|nr:hypothetical protein [Akkermansia sp.]
MLKRLLAACSAALMLQSCLVCTSEGMLHSCQFNGDAKPVNEEWATCCYIVDDACYLPVTVVYSNNEYASLFVYMPRLKEVKFNKGSRHREPETLYYRMSAKDAKLCTGLTLPEPAADARPYLTAEEWDAAKAKRVPLKRRFKDIRMGYSNHVNREADGQLVGYLEAPEMRYSADAIIKLPLTAILFVGVDVPCTAVRFVLGLPYYLLQ